MTPEQRQAAAKAIWSCIRPFKPGLSDEKLMVAILAEYDQPGPSSVDWRKVATECAGAVLPSDWEDDDVVRIERILAEATRPLEERIARLEAVLRGVMPWIGKQGDGPTWGTPEARARNEEMCDEAFAEAEATLTEKGAADA